MTMGVLQNREEDCMRPDGVKTHYYSPRMENNNWTRPHREKEKTQTERAERQKRKRQGQREGEVHSMDKEMMFNVFVN